MVRDPAGSPCTSCVRESSVCVPAGPQATRSEPSDVVLLHVLSDCAVEVQLCPVVCVHGVSVLLFDTATAAAPLGTPMLVEEAAYHSQSTHGDEDHCCDHT